MRLAAIFGCAGPVLLPEERAFYREADPLGFILFARNVENPDQLRRLTADLRESVGRDALVLVDQEGGRVARLYVGLGRSGHLAIFAARRVGWHSDVVPGFVAGIARAVAKTRELLPRTALHSTMSAVVNGLATLLLCYALYRLYAELGEYEFHVFTEFRELRDDLAARAPEHGAAHAALEARRRG